MDPLVRPIVDAYARRRGLFVVACLCCGNVKSLQSVPSERAGISDGIHPSCFAEFKKRRFGGKRVA